MTLFLTTSLGYPTLAWSIVLGGLLLFWLVAALGMLGMDALDIDLGDGDAGGMVSRLGLDGLPTLVVLSVLAFFAWILTYFVHLLVLAPLPALLRYGLGTVVLLLSPVPAICHGPWVLANADVLKGRTVTSVPNIRQDLENAGAKWVDEDVVVDQGLITSRTPDDLPAFCAKLVEEIDEGRHRGQARSAA